MRSILAVLILTSTALAAGRAQETRLDAEANAVQRDIEFARVDGHHLLLDLYLPRTGRDWPLVVWIHGGAWRAGSKADMPLTKIVDAGNAVASVDYRLSPVAVFPAQIHDCKAAIRFLRAKASEYGYNATRIAVAGASAGGHLAALVGTTNGHAELEGQVGADLDQSSDVQTVIDLYGPTNFETILTQSTPHGLGVRVPALKLLLGGPLHEKWELARLASPVHHVDANDPPLLLIHGDQDPQVPINQSHELHAKYQALGLPIQFEVVAGAAHGGGAFHDRQRSELMKEFLDKHIGAER